MNNTIITYYVMPSLTNGPIGDCKTLASAKTLAKKHGVSMIYARSNGALNGSAFMVNTRDGWSLLSAKESDFANYECDASVARVDGPNGMRRIDWTAEPNTVTVRPSEISEPLLAKHTSFNHLKSVMTKHVARSAAVVDAQFIGISDDDICLKAAEITTVRYMRDSQALTSPQMTVRLLQAHLGHLQSEQFHVLFLDSQHRLIKHEVLAYGTIDGASVYPREVIKAALKANAAAVIFAHNHPSGLSDASGADKAITERLVKALALVDIRVLDHMIIGDGEFTSFAEKGWL
tara:strand:- start:969 stop:1838 length:870 start_codon:yes stop_codon:yes gene_type:complete